MKQISPDALASVEFEVKWNHGNISHADTYMARKVNFWRDCLPREFYETMMGKKAGDRVRLELPADMLRPRHDPGKIKSLGLGQFGCTSNDGDIVTPEYGRFYPSGLLKGIPGVFKGNTTPFRCLGADAQTLRADFNHPLAGKPVEIEARVTKVFDKIDERGGTSNAWFETITDGPGIQARANGRATEFFAGRPFDRPDMQLDSLFYEKPRMVNHLDSRARAVITGLYRRLVPEKARVLDLMSSWNSHLPEEREFAGTTGLGMNADEMRANPRLTDFVVCDLNRSPELPFDDASYDTVVCTASIEYLVSPFEVFNEVARMLAKGGLFVVTFSNRWFPPKVTRIWREIHEFERMGLVSEYFLVSGTYGNISTCSMRGLARPVDDKYYPSLPEADPVYAVYGYKK